MDNFLGKVFSKTTLLAASCMDEKKLRIGERAG